MYSVGKPLSSWGDGDVQTITFVVTEDCNLRCKYCYIIHKNSTNKMNLETARECVDFALEGSFKRSSAVILEFIGGEPLLEIDIIDQVCDYFKVQAYKLRNDWYWNYRISICTNGINYLDERFQRFLDKNHGKISCNITIDGTKEKHDINRIFANGEGSFNHIEKGLKNYIGRGFNSTKVTFASDDLKYLFDSIVFLWELGITEVAANVVFEDVWKDGDEDIFEEQLKRLADYIVDNKLYSKYKCSFFDDTIGYSYSQKNKSETFCGAGKMMAFDCNGNIYPCIRYMNYSLNKKEPRIIGNIYDGINMEMLRAYELAEIQYQSDDECLNCAIATGCGFCQGFNYDESKEGTNFYRAKYICKMHKARVRANNYYFAKLYNQEGIDRHHKGKERYMYFLLDDSFCDYCCEHNSLSKNKLQMTKEILEKGLEYCSKYFYHPIFVHSNQERVTSELEKNYILTHIVYYSKECICNEKGKIIYAFNQNNYMECKGKYFDSAIVTIDASSLNELYIIVFSLWDSCDRVNIFFQNISAEFDFGEYERQLSLLVKEIERIKIVRGVLKEINILTDAFVDSISMCGLDNNSVTMAPDGNLYPCAGFYIRGEKDYILGECDLMNSCENRILYKKNSNPLCMDCNANNCVNCAILNKRTTGEFCISSSFQCKKGILEHNKALELQQYIKGEIWHAKLEDPFAKIIKNKKFGMYMDGV